MMAIISSKHLVRNDTRMRIAPTARRNACIQIVAANIGEPGQLRIEQGHIEEITVTSVLASVEGRQYAHRRIHARRDIRNGNRKAHRASVGLTGETHHSGLSLREDVVTRLPRLGPGEAVPRNRAINQARMFRTQSLRINAAPFQRLDRRLIAHEHIRASEQAMEDLAALGLIVIESDRALIPIGRKKVSRLRANEGRPPGAGLVTDAGSLQLNHVGSEIAQQHRAIRPPSASASSTTRMPLRRVAIESDY